MIRHTGFPDNGSNPTLGNCYMQVARVVWDKAANASGVYKSIPIMNAAMDGRFLKVTNKPDFFNGIEEAGEMGAKSSKIEWHFLKPEADLSRPLSHAKSIGVVSLGIRGISAAESHDDGKLTGVQSDAWASFTPSDAFLDAVNQQLYDGATAITKELTGGKIIGPEVIGQTHAYKESNLMSETNDGTASSYTRSYKTDKLLSDAAIQTSFRPVTDGQTITDEAGVDALLSVVFDLSLSLTKGGTMLLTPTLKYTLYGKPGGINVIPTTIVSGTVTSKDIKVSKKTTDAELMELIAMPDMLKALAAALNNIKQKEMTSLYEKAWSL
jgi:hypothetical protein